MEEAGGSNPPQPIFLLGYVHEAGVRAEARARKAQPASEASRNAFRWFKSALNSRVMRFEMFDDVVTFVEGRPMLRIDEVRDLILPSQFRQFVVRLLVDDLLIVCLPQTWVVVHVRDSELREFLSYLFTVWTAFELVQFEHCALSTRYEDA